MISYRIGNALDLDQVIDLYRSCSLGARRPVDDRGRMQSMLDNANLVITAWDAAVLIGISRSISDFAYATYLSDLAVRETHQRRGVGRELIRRTQAKGGGASVILLSAPAAADYYPRIGMHNHPSAWVLGSDEALL